MCAKVGEWDRMEEIGPTQQHQHQDQDQHEHAEVTSTTTRQSFFVSLRTHSLFPCNTFGDKENEEKNECGMIGYLRMTHTL